MTSNKAESSGSVKAPSPRRRARGEGAISQRKDGRWMGRLDLGWQGGKRIRRVYYGATRTEVAGKLSKGKAEEQAGVDPIRDVRLTVGKFLEHWLENTARPRVRPKTYRFYEFAVRLHLVPALGRIRVAELTTEQVETFLSRKLRDGLSARTVHHLRAILRGALADAVKRDHARRNVAALADPPRMDEKEPTIISPEAAQTIIESVKEDRLEALFVTAIASGLRQGELLALRWQDLNLEKGTVAVNGALQRIGGEFQRVAPKTRRSARTIALPSFAVDALHSHKDRQEFERKRAESGWHESGYVFTQANGEPLHGSNVTRRLHDLLPKELRQVTFHQLRHAYASLLVALGVHPRVVMEALGHSNISLTMNLYSHVVPALQRDAADQLDNLLKQAQPHP